MLRFYQFLFLIILLSLQPCALQAQQPAREDQMPVEITVTDISKGLPVEGLWREKLALKDVNADGWLDIIAPPRRKEADKTKKRPWIFVWSPKEAAWKEKQFRFPEKVDYDYGGIAVQDINGDGFFDIMLASHTGGIIPLIQEKEGEFVHRPFPIDKKAFLSRNITLSDLNADGWLDILSLTQSSVVRLKRSKPDQQNKKSILIGINKKGQGWDARLLEGSEGVFGDSIAAGDINGDGVMDIASAPLTGWEKLKNLIWLGDGKGNYRNHPVKFAEGLMTRNVRCGDVDGDGRSEVTYILSERGAHGKYFLKIFKMKNNDFQDLSSGLEKLNMPLVFDMFDLDGDGAKELAAIDEQGLHIFRLSNMAWSEVAFKEIPTEYLRIPRDLRVGKQADGTFIIAYNLGSETGERHGIRAYLVKMK